jgi:hypothetical protein
MAVDAQTTLEVHISFNARGYANETIDRTFGFAA